jgi:hypothetical protein
VEVSLLGSVGDPRGKVSAKPDLANIPKKKQKANPHSTFIEKSLSRYFYF